MALSAPTLSAALRVSLAGRGFIADGPELTAFCDDIAAAVVAHIVSNAVVTVPALGLISPGGMTPAPVTGAATGSIT
jgi:hypothetical protein